MEKPTPSRDEIDLVQLAKVLVKKKWVIIGGTIIITLLAVIISLLLPRVYKSEGFFQLGRGIDIDLNELKEIQEKIKKDLQDSLLDNQTLQNTLLVSEALQNTEIVMMNVSLPDYKKYASQFTNPQKFIGFIKEKKKPDKKELNNLVKSIRTFQDVEQWMEPVYAYSKKDLKELAQSTKDLKNFVLGIQLWGEQDSPEKARAFLEMLGEFIKDSILYGKLRDYLAVQLNKCKTESKKYDNLIIDDEFKLRQLTAKRGSIEQILKKYPDSKGLMNRELFALQQSGQRYLSPVAQLVGIESQAADIKENLAQNQRKKQLADLKLLFFLELKKKTDTEKFGESFLAQCIGLTDTFLDKENFSGDVTREARNSLAVDFDNLTTFKEEMQFVSGPTFSKKPIKPNRLLITAIGLVLGFFLAVFMAFFLDWWSINKKKIVADKPGGEIK